MHSNSNRITDNKLIRNSSNRKATRNSLISRIRNSRVMASSRINLIRRSSRPMAIRAITGSNSLTFRSRRAATRKRITRNNRA